MEDDGEGGSERIAMQVEGGANIVSGFVASPPGACPEGVLESPRFVVASKNHPAGLGSVGARTPFTGSGMDDISDFDFASPAPSDEILGSMHVLTVPRLHDVFSPDENADFPNVRWAASRAIAERASYSNFIDDTHLILKGVVRKLGPGTSPHGDQLATPEASTRPESGVTAFVRAGPRARLFFSPPEVRAAIATCGGIAPGVNDVVRAIVKDLHELYGVESIMGIRWVVRCTLSSLRCACLGVGLPVSV